MKKMACAEHDWNATSMLRLVVREPDKELFSALFPTPPALVQIEYCRQCGAMRLPEDILTALTDAERVAG